MCSKKKKITSINIKRREERRFLYISISYGDCACAFLVFGGIKKRNEVCIRQGRLAGKLN